MTASHLNLLALHSEVVQRKESLVEPPYRAVVFRAAAVIRGVEISHRFGIVGRKDLSMRYQRLRGGVTFKMYSMSSDGVAAQML